MIDIIDGAIYINGVVIRRWVRVRNAQTYTFTKVTTLDGVTTIRFIGAKT